MTPTSNATLAAQGLTLAYGDARVLEGVSLELRAGEIVGLIGPNGSGKSTLIKALIGLLAPRAGRVTLDGEPLTGLSRQDIARRVAYVPQRLSANATPPFTLLELALQGRHPHRRGLFDTRGDRERAEEALRQTEVWSLRDRRLDEVSGGEAQRALIAAALCQEPRWLLLDEPSSALDLHFGARLFQLLTGLREDAGVLVATHDLNLASLHCDRLLLLEGGALRAQGSPADVLTQALLSEVYGPELRVVEHPDAPERPMVLPGVPP